VIGCSVAYYLRGAGAEVVLLERGELAGEASGAAAGLLILPDRATAPGPFRELCVASLDMYRELIPRIEKESGVDVHCLASGILVTAEAAERVPILRSFAEWQRGQGIAAEWVEGEALRALEPALSPRVLGAVYTADDLNVDPAMVTQAIGRAAQRSGVDVRTQVSVAGFLRRGGQVEGVTTTEGTVKADAFVLAAGPWTGLLASKLGVRLKTPPMRGQMLAYETGAVRHAIWGENGYLVPKLALSGAERPVLSGVEGTGGLLYAGATVEDAGFRKHTTKRGLAGLRAMAAKLVPSLRRADVASAWAGLRPGSEDGWPVIGRLPGQENVYVATGHFRNGILLAPATGKLVTQMVLEGGTEMDVTAFGAERFQVATTTPH
jgi:glycine oxidase